MKKIIIGILLLYILSCTTTEKLGTNEEILNDETELLEEDSIIEENTLEFDDAENNQIDDTESNEEELEEIIFNNNIIEREIPVYLYVDPYTDIIIEEAKDSNLKGVIYDYNPLQVFPVNCAVNMTTNIRLEPEEYLYSADHSIIIGDSRWELSTSLSYEQGKEVAHILIKPWEPGLQTSLVITTTRRTYNLLLISTEKQRNPIVSWRYNDNKNDYLITEKKIIEEDQKDNYISTNYIIKRPKNAPPWTPRTIYDDGKQTYIILPQGSQNYEIPVVTGLKGEVFNQRLIGNTIKLDTLIEEVYLINGKTKIKVIKDKE